MMSNSRAPSVEPLNRQDTISQLPNTIEKYRKEQDSDGWYWRTCATLASFLILVGFLVFPGAIISGDNTDLDNQQTMSVMIAALVFINAGFILSVALWFLRKNKLFQLECIFLPCLYASLAGVCNTLIAPTVVLRTFVFTAPALASLIVSLIAVTVYGVLSIVTSRSIQKLRQASQTELQRDRNLVWKTDEELQRLQFNQLYQVQGETVTAAQFKAYRTYNIDPIIPQRSTEPYENLYGNNYSGVYNTM